MMLGIQDIVLNTGSLQHSAQLLGCFDGDSTDENRLARPMTFNNLFNYRVEFFFLRTVNQIRMVCPDHHLVRWDDNDFQLVSGIKLFGLGIRSARHSPKLFKHAKIILKGNRRQRLVLIFYFNAFFGLKCLMKPITIPPSKHHPAGELVNDDDLSILDHIIDFILKQNMRLERLIGMVKHLNIGRIIKVIQPQQLLRQSHTLLRHHDRFGFFIHIVMRAFL